MKKYIYNNKSLLINVSNLVYKKVRDILESFNLQFDFSEPFIGCAIHKGHFLHSFVKNNLAISDEIQLMEEDPFTDTFLDSHYNKIIVNLSRFEVDMNRKRDKCIYQTSCDAWGLITRKNSFTNDELQFLYSEYDDFYKMVEQKIDQMLKIFKKIVVFDIHSYNHRRNGQNALPDDPDKNPEIIIGTSNMPSKWQPLIDKIQSHISTLKYFDRYLDVRRNIKYPGGNFPRWLHDKYPEQVCCVSFEFKKIFMDEWSGKVDNDKLHQLNKIIFSAKSFLKKTFMK